MKLIYAAFATLFIFFAVTFILPMQKLRAEDIVQMNNSQDITMSGTITDLSSREFVLSTGDSSTNVSLEGMQTNATIDDILKNGMKVTVRGTLAPGKFNEPMIKASSISAYQDPLQPGAPVPPTGTATPNAKPAQ